MKERRSMPVYALCRCTPHAALVMARHALVWRFLRDMARDAESHRQIDVAFGDRLLRDVAVAARAVDAGANVGRVIEPHVRLGGVSVHALPRDLDAAALVI